jgi:hypothetical protein
MSRHLNSFRSESDFLMNCDSITRGSILLPKVVKVDLCHERPFRSYGWLHGITN